MDENNTKTYRKIVQMNHMSSNKILCVEKLLNYKE